MGCFQKNCRAVWVEDLYKIRKYFMPDAIPFNIRLRSLHGIWLRISRLEEKMMIPLTLFSVVVYFLSMLRRRRDSLTLCIVNLTTIQTYISDGTVPYVW